MHGHESHAQLVSQPCCTRRQQARQSILSNLIFTWLPRYLGTCVLLDNNQPAGWDAVISLSLSLSLNEQMMATNGGAEADESAGLVRLTCPGGDAHALINTAGGEALAHTFPRVQLFVGREGSAGEGLLLITTRHAMAEQFGSAALSKGMPPSLAAGFAAWSGLQKSDGSPRPNKQAMQRLIA